MSRPTIEDDPVLTAMLHDAIVDPDTLGLILGGSRAAGCAHTDSDYDLFWVLTDRAYIRRQEGNDALRIKRTTRGQPVIDIVFTCLQDLANSAEEPGWWSSTYATAIVVLDKSGQVLPAVEELATLPEDRARSEAIVACDSYLNAFYRSLRSWSRGDQLGARLHAADSVLHLVQVLFLLERRWPPHHDHLFARVHILETQGWSPGVLPEALLRLVRDGDPRLQQEMEERVEILLRARGLSSVVDGWSETLQRARALHFD